MIDAKEIDGPSWFDKTYEVSIDNKPVMQLGVIIECLLTRQLYLGIELIRRPTKPQLRQMKRSFKEHFSGCEIRCFTDSSTEARKFAKFFGFEYKETCGNAHWYEGSF